jgi:PIN domain nuclease of toxin-antitoxin system
MRLLLDTHVFLWWVEDAPDLSRKARRSIGASSNECFISLASCWEMAIKLSLGKLRLQRSIEKFIPEQLAANRFRLLNLDLGHVGQTASLPFHHRDPFDRLLIAQAIHEKMSVVTADRDFAKYDIDVVW